MKKCKEPGCDCLISSGSNTDIDREYCIIHTPSDSPLGKLLNGGQDNE